MRSLTDFIDAEQEDRLRFLFQSRFKGDDKTKELLALIAAHDGWNPEITSALLETLYDNQMVHFKGFAIEKLRDESSQTRYFACEALGWLGNEKDLVCLEALTEDLALAAPFDEQVSFAAMRAIQRIRDRAKECEEKA